ncbi:ATP-sensitive inward rectifier potassium channel 1-like isoform 2-T2 [Clarias gariepinus]|uniref:ATP-sensitive inward rectifier potassium channel 1-like isoform X2 n=1 Tax=Clarias gariepinus TaxID=13013 RepID=UPI00234D34E8|nr:ATP-sensitive inward rectifier potassium channel 1-like isoform X2 [Clarias gariepinus]
MARSLPQLLLDYLTKRRIHRNRLVTKDGHCNIAYGSVTHSQFFIYFLDFWTTLMEMRWRYVLFLFAAAYVLGWFIFGLLWYWAAFANGDLYWQNPPPDHNPCVINVFDLTGAFLQSIESQMSIGFGYRMITTYCPSTITILTFQVVFGTVMICFWCGVIMTKVARGKKRGKTINFSKIAVISSHKDKLCLQIRVANIRKSLMVGSQIYGKLLQTTITPEAQTIQQQEFELVVFLDGTAESTSSSCQVRTSYLPKEILWGYQFLPIISRSKEGKYHVDFSNFAKVAPVETVHYASHFAESSNGFHGL